ncbi:hypothetical protein GEMRC1_000336 [Eukaryota sp. GEM-RC1]
MILAQFDVSTVPVNWIYRQVFEPLASDGFLRRDLLEFSAHHITPRLVSGADDVVFEPLQADVVHKSVNSSRKTMILPASLMDFAKEFEGIDVTPANILHLFELDKNKSHFLKTRLVELTVFLIDTHPSAFNDEVFVKFLELFSTRSRDFVNLVWCKLPQLFDVDLLLKSCSRGWRSKISHLYDEIVEYLIKNNPYSLTVDVFTKVFGYFADNCDATFRFLMHVIDSVDQPLFDRYIKSSHCNMNKTISFLWPNNLKFLSSTVIDRIWMSHEVLESFNGLARDLLNYLFQNQSFSTFEVYLSSFIHYYNGKDKLELISPIWKTHCSKFSDAVHRLVVECNSPEITVELLETLWNSDDITEFSVDLIQLLCESCLSFSIKSSFRNQVLWYLPVGPNCRTGVSVIKQYSSRLSDDLSKEELHELLDSNILFFWKRVFFEVLEPKTHNPFELHRLYSKKLADVTEYTWYDRKLFEESTFFNSIEDLSVVRCKNFTGFVIDSRNQNYLKQCNLNVIESLSSSKKFEVHEYFLTSGSSTSISKKDNRSSTILRSWNCDGNYYGYYSCFFSVVINVAEKTVKLTLYDSNRSSLTYRQPFRIFQENLLRSGSMLGEFEFTSVDVLNF